jgi:hypothetical protein
VKTSPLERAFVAKVASRFLMPGGDARSGAYRAHTRRGAPEGLPKAAAPAGTKSGREFCQKRRFRGTRALLVSFCAAIAACATVGMKDGLSQEQVAKLPPQVAESYEIFARRCSRCHNLSRPLSANIKDLDHWRLYVTRMRRQPGSGISEEEAERILVFLDYYAREIKPGPKEGGAQ